MRELNEAEEIPPTITMGMMDGREFIDALVRYVREKKLDKQSEDRVVGELDATKRHLEDMRTLVFDKSEIVVSGVSDGELPKR